MPSYYIMPLLEKRKQRYWGQICEARENLAQFEESLNALVGTEVAAVIRLHLHPSLAMRHRHRGGTIPVVPLEGLDALVEAQRLIRAETSITRRLHRFPCAYVEDISPPYVLRYFGLTWDDLETMHRDGVLPLGQVVWLLGIVQHEKMRLPTAEELELRGRRDGDEADSVEGWHRLLKRRRRRLVKFLQIAVHLEEDLRKGFA